MNELIQWAHEAVQWLVAFVHQFGILGIFIMTFIESTFVPLPSEAVMIPAGYLIHQGKMSFWLVFPASVLGTIGGAYFNYWLARHWGRALFTRYGNYMLLPPHKLAKMEAFFATHGAISTFIGRLIPGIRHYIPFPAGLARMDRRVFLLYTGLGGGLWMGVLLAVGYYIGQNEALLGKTLLQIKGVIFASLVVLILGYRWHLKRKKG